MSRSLRTIAHAGALGCALCLPLAAPLLAQTASPLSFVNNVFTRSVGGAEVFTQSTIGPVVVAPVNVGGSIPVGFGLGPTPALFTSTTSGTAAALQSTLRASASLSAYQPLGQPADNRTVKSEADFTKRVTVQAAPGSGLVAGSAVNLSLNLRFDGLMQMGFPAGPPGTVVSLPDWNRLLTSADILMRYRVTDLTNRVIGGENAGAPTLIGSVGYNARIVVEQSRATDGTAWSEDINDGWSGFTNGSGASAGPRTRSYAEGNSPIPYTFERNVDLGVLSFVLQTTVGAELEIRGDLDVFLQALGLGLPAFSVGGFSNTFDADLFSETPGVTLLGEERGVYGRPDSPTTVPEPTTWWLMASGLAGLAMVARRRPALKRGR